MKYKVGDRTLLGEIKCIEGWNKGREYGIVSDNCYRWLSESEIDKIVVKPTGDISDGYHTFDELYYQRAILFSVICRLFPDKAWKSKLHADGTMFEDHFIVGIDTPLGQYTYHYSMAKWPLFPVKNVDRAPEYDGHTADNVTRLFSLVKPKRNIDHLIELWEAHREEDARKEFLKIIYNESMGAEEGDEIYELMKLYAEPSRYPKLTPEELKAVRWLWDGGYESIVRDGCAYACYDRVKASVLINPITNLLADSSWITPKPINLAELLAAQEE